MRLAVLAIAGLWTLFLLGASCDRAPYRPHDYMTLDGARPVAPSSVHAMWWFEAEECTGLRGDFRDWLVLSVPTRGRGGFQCFKHNEYCLGFADTENKRIYIADLWLGRRGVMVHEFLHALGINGHPIYIFNACGGW